MKKKLGKKLLALILSMSLLFSVIPSMPVLAANEVYGILTTTTTGTDIVSTIYNCDSDGKNPGSTQIAMEAVTNLFIASDVEIIPSKSDSKNYLKLVSITIPPNVRVIEEAFGVSPKLENIDFSNATGLEEIIGHAFTSCDSLKTVDLSKTINLRALENANIESSSLANTFSECNNLEAVILPKNLEKIGNFAFVACSKLADVTFLSKKPPIVGLAAFDSTKDQIRLHLPAGSNANEWEAALSRSNASNPVFIVDNKYGIYKNDGNVYKCDENAVPTTAIADKKALTHLFIADDVTAIKNNAFSECSNIMEVNFSNATSLISIGDYAFSDCGNIETMVIPNTVTSIGEFAFANCKNLNSITLPKDITKIRNSMFAECNKLERIEIPQNVTEINDLAFCNCQSLSSVSFQSALPPTFGTSSFENTKDEINVFLNNTADENIWREKLLAAGMTNPKFAKDATPPTAQITVGDAIFTTASDPVTFDTLLKDKVEITITASDPDSAIKTIEYQEVSSEADYNVDGTWKPYTDKFDVNYLGKNIIYARATDLAGNQTIINTNGFIIYTDSQLQTEVTEFDRKEENQRDMFVRILLNGNTLKSITNGETVLENGTDYIIGDSPLAMNSVDYPESSSLILYIQKSYLAKLRSGIQTLNFNFDPYAVEGSLVIHTPLEITIKDTGHVHDFATEFTIDRNSTCTEKGEKSKHCKDFALCGGKTDITEVELALHAFFDVRSFDENEHWNLCGICSGKVNVEKHIWTTSKNQPGGENVWGMDFLLFADLVAPSHGETPTILDYRCTGCKATKREEYKLTQKIHDMTTGDNSIYTNGTTDGATFVSVGNINDYLGTTINGIPIRLGDIKVKSGSTIVTISREYMDTLPNGKHTISIYSTTGTATANFTVVGNKEIVNPEKPTNPKTPSTGDNGTMPLWISLLFISGGALTLFGISKKRRKVKAQSQICGIKDS